MAADTVPAGPALTDRGRVLQIWQDGGLNVKAAAEAALVGGDAKIASFLGAGTTPSDGEMAKAEAKDNRQATLQIVTTGGPRLRKAAETALAGSDQAVSTFLVSGWKPALEQDRRVAVSQLAETGGPRTKAAALKALNGSAKDIEKYLSDGQHTTRESDERVRVSQVVEAGGPATKQAGLLAMNGSIEDIREFLAVGQHIAAARDREYADISQLVKQATEAGNQAEREKTAAVEASEQAITSARLARQAAETAKAEAQAAKGDAKKAASAAQRAADAGRRAAEAARAAIASARAANNAARVAASAASQAAAAAAGAERAATKALSFAASGKIDEEAAKAAETAANLSNYIADVADRAAVAATAAAAAARAATSAGNNLDGATLAAEEANGFASEAGSFSQEAQDAAASARRHATEATRAANRAAALADQSAAAAREAGAYARSAANHASKAAEAARDSSKHAGNATTAAQRANAHAASAQTAATAAVAAVKKASDIHTQAAESEKEEREARKLNGINQARDLRAAFDLSQRQADAAKDEAVKLEQDAVRLAQQAAQPGVDTATVVANGRKMAIAALTTRGSWSKAAATYALTGSDQAVLDYVKSSWTVSAQQDERVQAGHLADDSKIEAVRTAATTALAGDATQVHAFLQTGRHQVALSEYRVRVSQILETGGSRVKAAAQEALRVNTAEALTTFLSRGQYTARASDDQVLISTYMEDGSGRGEEVKIAAAIAMESPGPVKADFLKTGQYRAKQQDELTLAHNATIANLLSSGSQVAALAVQNAALASKAAADANNASNDANKAAGEAQAAAADAARYADDAKKSANQADASAADARASAATARNAAAQAWASANAAQDSARAAAASAAAARQSADTAYEAVAAARKSAENAQESSDKAAAIAKAAEEAAIAAADKAKDEQDGAEFWALIDSMGKEQQPSLSWGDVLNAYNTYQKYFGISTNPADYSSYDKFAEMVHFKLDMLGLVPVLGEPADFVNCLWTGGEWLADKASGEDFGLSCFSMIPIAGWAGAGTKLIKKYGKKAWDAAGSAYDWAAGFFKKKPNGIPDLCPTNSFPAGTRVLMGDGSTKPIEQVRIGDAVQAADPVTGRNGPRAVTNTIYTPDDRQFTELTIKGGAKLTSTDHHPYWVESTRTWTDAVAVKPGDTLRTDADAAVQVAAVRHWTGLAPAYNLTVDDLHTYHVLIGDTPVLVHNTDPLPCLSPKDIANLDLADRKAYVEAGRAARDAARADGWPLGTWNAMALLDSGLTVNEVGLKIWKKNGPDVKNVLDGESAAYLRGLASKRDVEDLYDMYMGAAARAPSNKTAQNRIYLLRKVLAAWPE
ncbi:polymorphic toxin-type HINT domain-containing protein [Streptomyces nojiriensis]|uniref:polymorphic toxin-type HINT domain-containing protein n=1 Tax=Streptomyces nojiriensis TaxID=66374 RepID=UPI002E18B7B8